MAQNTRNDKHRMGQHVHTKPQVLFYLNRTEKQKQQKVNNKEEMQAHT